jgi:tetratricopeptide (TPR) repeat protein
LPWFVLGVLAVLPPAALERKNIALYAADFSLSLLERGLLAGRAFWFYLGKLVWPTDLVFMYPRWTVDSKVWWQHLFPVGALAVLAGLWLVSRRNRGPLAAFLIFIGTLFPILGFINVMWFAISYVGDHLQYLPCLGIIVLFASGVACIVKKLPVPIRWVAQILVAGMVVILGVLTWRQSGMYRDAETLYRATLARNPTCWVAHYNLGDALNGLPGRQAEVIAEWETALRYKPDFAEAHNNLATILSNIPGRVPEAIGHYEQALRYKPDFAEAHNNLATVLSNYPDRIPEAIEHFEAALRYDPDSAETHNNFGNVLIDVPGRLNEAIAQIEAALRLQPDYAEAHWNLSIALSKMPGRLPEAITHLETALRLKPDLEGGRQMLEHLRELQRQRLSGNPAPPS